MNLTYIFDENDYDIINDDNDIDNEIINYISKKGFVRRNQLVKDLMNKHPHERGYSERTINRRIDKMIKSTIILNIESEIDLKRYGIQKKDGRAKYLTLKRSANNKEHLDYVFDILIFGDEKHKMTALRELVNYQENYVLNGLQLDLLIQSLSNQNDELRSHLIRILFNHITKKNIKPLDEDKFRTVLKSLLKCYPKFDKSLPKNLRENLISLLGFSDDDDAIVEQLIEDANGNEENFDQFYPAYFNKFCAKSIENHTTELFKLELKLATEGKEDAARLISAIKYQARLNLGMITPKKEETEEW